MPLTSGPKVEDPFHLTDKIGGPLADDRYLNFSELSDAVTRGEIPRLDEQEVIGRIYTVEQTKTIARHAGRAAQSAVDSVTGVQGINSCYERAEKLVNACAGNREGLGRAVLIAEHEHVFTLLSYWGIPTTWGTNAEEFWASFSEQQKITTPMHHFAKPFLKPGNLKPRLESARFDGSRVTLVFGQLRVMRKTHAKTNDVPDLFVARVPVLVSFLFDLGIVEISMPPFAEPPMPYHTLGFPQLFPGRVFKAIEMCRNALRTESYIQSPLVRLLRENLMVYLETEKKGEDLGWDVERLTGKKGKFNTTQRIPLKDILSDFTTDLATKCRLGGYVNPLEDKDLYQIFRTLKSESHTMSMNMGVRLGTRSGRVELTAFFGKDADGQIPLYQMLSRLTTGAREELRSAVAESRARKDLKDPYSMTNFKKKE